MPTENNEPPQDEVDEYFEFFDASRNFHTKQEFEKRLEKKHEENLKLIKRNNARTMSFVIACATVVSGVITGLGVSLYFEANSRMHDMNAMRIEWLEKNNEELRKTAEAHNKITQDMLVRFQEVYEQYKTQKQLNIANRKEGGKVNATGSIKSGKESGNMTGKDSD